MIKVHHCRVVNDSANESLAPGLKPRSADGKPGKPGYQCSPLPELGEIRGGRANLDCPEGATCLPGVRASLQLPSAVRSFTACCLAALLCICISLIAIPAIADDTLGDLAKPKDGRSMRSSSTFREGANGQYDSKAFPKG